MFIDVLKWIGSGMDIFECFKSREDNIEEKYKFFKLFIILIYGIDFKFCF